MWPHRWQPTRLPRPWDSPGKNTGVGCHFLLQCMKVKSESEVTLSCPTLCDPMVCSLPGSSVHGDFQARVLEWGSIAFSTTTVYYRIYMEFRKMVMITLYARQQKRQMYRSVLWTLWERERVGWFGRMALKYVYHMWNESPVQVRCMIQGTRGWRTGMTQSDGMGREVGGFRMGNTCTPAAGSCQCMAKPIQYCKVISLQLK